MIAFVQRHVIPAAYSLLPSAMASTEATAMLLAIGLQESKFDERTQMEGGPARGFWQFERDGAVRGVLEHAASRAHAREVLRLLRYTLPPGKADARALCHAVLEHNDVLACCFARLLLWTLPDSLPTRPQSERAWGQYMAAWRPGRPHKDTWPAHYLNAWNRVELQEHET